MITEVVSRLCKRVEQTFICHMITLIDARDVRLAKRSYQIHVMYARK